MKPRIDSFSGEYRWLSNFWEAKVVYDGRTYRTVEHAYQAAKTENFNERERIRMTLKPGDAKKLGKTLHVRGDWEKIRIAVMYELLAQKFAIPELGAKLLQTGDKDLIEGNRWGDLFWGVDARTGVGHNVLGQLLMLVRSQIRRNRQELAQQAGSMEFDWRYDVKAKK